MVEEKFVGNSSLVGLQYAFSFSSVYMTNVMSFL